MLNPVTIREETDEYVVYSFKTIYLHALYLILAAIGVGILFELFPVTATGIGLMVLYFLTVSVKYRKVGAITNEAARNGTVEVSGSKWSFSNPLTMKVPKSGTQQSTPADSPDE